MPDPVADAALKTFRVLLGGSPVPMWVYDRESLRFLEVNDGAVQTYGWTREEFLARTIKDIRPASEWPRLEALLHAPATWERVTEGWRHLTATGAILDVEVHSHPIEWGDRPATFVMALDVSARARTAQALRESEQLFRLLAEHASDLIALHDDSGSFIYASPAAQTILHLAPEALLERDLGHLVHEDDRPLVRAAFDRLRRGLPGPAVIFRASREDGTAVWLETTGQVIVGADADDRARFITVTRDITDRRRLEHQLSRSQKLEGLGRLAGGIAHDFNNLLTAILGHAEMASVSLPAESAARADLLEIRGAAERAAGLTRQLLAFARRQMITPRSVHAGTLLRELEQMLRRLLGEDLELAISIASELWPVHVDPTQLEQVILNLAVNARDAMPGGGRLSIAVRNSVLAAGDPRTGRDGPGGEFVEIVVTDTGVGMTPETMRHIFEPFYTTKDVGQGTGLGLATTYGIVTQSGGYITVKSVPGGGSAFTVLLPRGEALLPENAAPSPPETAAAAEVVLLAEDDDQLRALTVRALTARGYTVHAAPDGRAALEMAASLGGAIDLLVTDIVMPRLSGIALATQLREQRPGIRVLYVSGYASEWADGGHTLAEEELLQKPWTTDELYRRVRARLESPA